MPPQGKKKTHQDKDTPYVLEVGEGITRSRWQICAGVEKDEGHHQKCFMSKQGRRQEFIHLWSLLRGLVLGGQVQSGLLRSLAQDSWNSFLSRPWLVEGSVGASKTKQEPRTRTLTCSLDPTPAPHQLQPPLPPAVVASVQSRLTMNRGCLGIMPFS